MHTIGIVNYNSHLKIKQFLISVKKYNYIRIYIYDNNSKTHSKNMLKSYKKEFHQVQKIIFGKKNIGFGRSHNKIIELIRGFSSYHHIVNPDIEILSDNFFENIENDFSKFYSYAMVPRIVNSLNLETFNSKKFPTLISLLISRLFHNPNKSKYFNLINGSESPVSKYHSVQVSSGAYIILRKEFFVNFLPFDNRFFLYFEDVDFFKSIWRKKMDCLYNPNLVVKHLINRESNRNFRLFLIHLWSFILYLLKWGIKIY